MIDSRDPKELHPCLQRGLAELIRRLRGVYSIGISSTYRDKERQNTLYSQGRTIPGNIVTNAKGGQSIHNYRLAFDVFKNVKGQEFSDASFFTKVGSVWTEMGGTWGGSWVGFVDKPHMEYTGGLALAKLQAGVVLPNNAKMPWEANTTNKPKEENIMEKRYQTIEEVPAAYRATVSKLIRSGALSGTGTGLNLSEDMARILVILDRAGALK